MLKMIDDRRTRQIHPAADDDGRTLCDRRIVKIRQTRFGPAGTITCSVCAAKVRR